MIKEVQETKELVICDFCGKDENYINMYPCAICGKDTCSDCCTNYSIDVHNSLHLCKGCANLDFTEYIKTNDKLRELNRETHQIYRKLEDILKSMNNGGKQ